MHRFASLLTGRGCKLFLLALALAFPLFAKSEYQVYVMASAFIWAIARMVTPNAQPAAAAVC